MNGQDAVNSLIGLHGNPGQRFGITGPDYAECTAVPHSLQRNILPDPYDVVYGHAKDIFGNAPDALYLKAGPGDTLLPGDIVSQGGDPVLGTDPRFGHTFVVAGVSQPGQPILGYSQNYPTGQQPALRWFPRNGLIGAIRAKVLQSGGGNMDDHNALEWINAAKDSTYIGLQMHVPTPGENSKYGGDTFGQWYAAVINDRQQEARKNLTALLISWYNYGLGRSFRNIPINIDKEITPRVEQLLRRQTTPRDHWLNIIGSPEGVAWAEVLTNGSGLADSEAAHNLETARQLAEQAMDTITKITKL